MKKILFLGSISMLPIFFILFILLFVIGGALNGGNSFNKKGIYECKETLAINHATLDTVFQKSGVFKDKKEKFLELAEKYGIDPILFMAIAMNETAWGTSKAVVEKNNPGGLMTSTGLMVFETLDEGLESMGLTLHNRMIVDGKVTIEDLGAVYAPVGATNDPNGLNVNWVPNVTNIAEQLGGLTMTCTISEGFFGDLVDAKEYFNIVMSEALKYKGYPYAWGGSNPNTSFDCSGLTQWCFAKAGIQLPRTALEQFNVTEEISADEARAGDLVFFYGTYGGANHLSHVGIYLGNGKMYNSNDSGVGYSDIADWAEFRPTFGRLISN